VPVKHIAFGTILISTTSLVALLAWASTPVAPLWVEKIRFSLVLAAILVSTLPLTWMHLDSATSNLRVFRISIPRNLQRFGFLLVVLLFLFAFLWTLHALQKMRSDIIHRIASERLQTTQLFIDERIAHMMEFSELESTNSHPRPSTSYSTRRTDESHVPGHCALTTPSRAECLHFEYAPSQNMLSITLFKKSAQKKNEILALTSSIPLRNHALLPHSEWHVAHPGNSIAASSAPQAPQTLFLSSQCAQEQGNFLVANSQHGAFLLCPPTHPEDVYSQRGNQMIFRSIDMKTFPGKLVLTTPAEHPLWQTLTHIAGSVLFIICLFTLAIWNILNQLWRTEQRANVKKSALVADISHELRNPINGIAGILDILSRTKLSFSQERLVRNGIAATTSITQIVNDVSMFSKLEAGTLELEFREFELRKTVEEQVANLSFLAATKNLDFNIFVESDVPEHLVGDRRKLGQILTNFLSNAIKYTERGKVSLRVTCKAVSASNVTLQFSVEDTGIGIPAKELPRLFKRFSRVANSQNIGIEGTGLGLSISHHFIHHLGGSIQVQSTENKGSLFEFTLPFTRQNRAEDWATSTQELLKGITVCVVGRERSRQNMLVSLFQSLGATTTHEHGENQDFQIACIDDWGSPSESAVLAGHIANRAPHKDPFIIQVTQSLGNSSEEFMRDNRILFQLTKPIGPHQLVECVRNHQSEIRLIRYAAQSSSEAMKETKARVGSLDLLKKKPGCLRILVAEDNPILQEVAVHQLEELGHKAQVAPNGEEAVRAILEGHYDLVFMDVRMPKLDGYEATQAVREQEAATGGHTTIVAMTASAMLGDKERCLAAGMDDYIAKPINTSDLARMIEKQAGENEPESTFEK
jgi:signal transduction histidine kinase/CheY-like chemotaxis protein